MPLANAYATTVHMGPKYFLELHKRVFIHQLALTPISVLEETLNDNKYRMSKCAEFQIWKSLPPKSQRPVEGKAFLPMG